MTIRRSFHEEDHLRIPKGHHGGGEFTKMGVVERAVERGQTASAFAHPSTGARMGKTEIGDTYEALFMQKGRGFLEKRFGHPYVQIAGGKGLGVTGGRGARNTPLDFRLDNRFGGELKTLNINAKNQRIAMKAEEQLRKIETARKNGWGELIVVQVVDQKTGTVHVYVHDSFESKRVHKMEHIGTYTYTQADFRKAQQHAGHWEKRHRRAVAV
jgi:uncharacterized protein (DUF736 family)